MKRSAFFRNASLAAIGASIAPSILANDHYKRGEGAGNPSGKDAKNIIFLVSDGMSTGTLNMADLLAQRKLGHGSYWVDLYRNNKVKRGLMDTASANSLVTDSAAASSAWGGGQRVFNGRVNMGENGEKHTPILQKFKKQNKAVGCVTSVPITHATPAGFCVNNKSRGNQSEIAEQYLDLRFDVMLGGGLEYFDASLRKDGKDLFASYAEAGYHVARSKSDLRTLEANEKPIMGVFHESAIPYAVDHASDKEKQQTVPTLAEMSQVAINQLSKNENGFVLQIEGGKVDWAAHGNDIGGLLFDQLAFDEAVKVALDFAEQRDDTLIIITTDHGNANPGLFYGKEADQNFDKIQTFKHSNEWVLNNLTKEPTSNQIVDIIDHAQGIQIKKEEAQIIQKHYAQLSEKDRTNSYKLPFEKLAQIQKKYTNVGWAGMHHSADFVEIAMLGAGSEMLPQFIKNFELHNFMLKAAGISVSR